MNRPLSKSRFATSAAGALAALGLAAGPAAAADFYAPPSSIPGQNGDLVRSEAQKLNASPGKATRIMYHSTDSSGNAVAVTGTYIEPSAKYSGSGPRPLVAYAEGTQGQGDKCAPSKSLESGYIGGSPGSVSIGYELPSINNLLNKGVAVVVTDYVGLGTTNRVHTYVNRLDQGHAMLDAARAALDVPGASVTSSSPVGLYGYSQGGGAAASAAELAPSYASDVNLKGAFAGAPPADLGAVMKTADGTVLTAVIGYAINGFLESYPQLKSILDAETNQAGKDALAKIANQCTADSIFAFATQKTSKWTTSGKSVSEVVAANPTAQAVVDQQKIGTLKPSVPVRIVTGTQDDIVTHGQVKQLAKDWCAKGASVNYVPVIQVIPTFGSSVNHLQPMLSEGGNSQNWLLDRLAGKSASSNCGTLGLMP